MSPGTAVPGCSVQTQSRGRVSPQSHSRAWRYLQAVRSNPVRFLLHADTLTGSSEAASFRSGNGQRDSLQSHDRFDGAAAPAAVNSAVRDGDAFG